MAYKSRTLTLGALLLCGLVVLALVLTLSQTGRVRRVRVPRARAFPPAPVCTLITPPSRQWSFNSRSFCHYPIACLSSPPALYLPPTPALCRHATAALAAYAPPRPCPPSDLARVTAAYNPGLIRRAPTPRAPRPLPPVAPTHTSVVFIPTYPFPANIYHFANVITQLAHLLPLQPFNDSVTLVFAGRRNALPWQAHFQTVVLAALRARFPRLRTVYLADPAEKSLLCARDVLVLGRRGHVNVWPFTNTTPVTPLAEEVPRDSVTLRRYFYQAYRIHHPLPTEQRPVIPPPPLVLGYSRRLGPGAVTGGNVHAIGTLRRFSDGDEIWFQGMLKEESRAAGVQLRIFTTSANDSLEAQVTNFATLGGVIGIHGANLVNSMFVPPLGLLIEIFPTNVTSPCYYAGSNAGLRYIRFESRDPATAEESGCTYGRCTILPRQRRVKIERDLERATLRDAVKQGLAYLTGLRKQFPNGVPVKQDFQRGVYQVVH